MQYTIKLFVLLIPVIVFLFYFSYTKNKFVYIFASLFLLAISAESIFKVGKYTYANYRQPPKWDFLCFWLDGKVALTGKSFYDVKNYQTMPLPYDPGNDFQEEILNVGFKYPPFTMFLFLPLGLFDISKAYLLWQILILFLCVACIYGLWKLFLKDYGILSLLLIAALMLGLGPARSTFSFSQTNFLNLLFFLLFWRNRSKAQGGVWLALCVVVKPYMAILYLYPLLTRKWRMFAAAVLTLLILTILSVLVFGSDVFISFIRNPIPKTPIWNYTEITNQSLLATILRSTQYQIVKGSPLLNPLYLGISLILTFTTTLMSIKNRSNNHDWIVLSILFLALIVYPANQVFYSVFLIVPVVLLLRQSSQSLRRGRIIIFFIIFITYFLSGYEGGSYIFFANIFMWFVCIVLGAKSSFEKILASDSTAHGFSKVA